MSPSPIRIAALFVALGIAFGAFGAHWVKSAFPAELQEVWSTAVFYHLLNAVGLLVIAGLQEVKKIPLTSPDSACATSRKIYAAPFWMILAGLLLFSGSLYLYVLTGSKLFAIITPGGGLLLIFGWAKLAFSKA